MKRIYIVASAIILLASLWSCQKKDEQVAAEKSPVPPGPIVDTQSGPQGHGTPGKKTEFKVVVPPEVEAQWSQVVIIVEDKQENKKEEFTVNIGGDLKLPDSDLTVKIGPFLPNFKMSGTVITSSSNETTNPSVGIAVSDGEKKLFPTSGEWGWLYAKFPTIHSFQHERFSLALKEGIKK
jgi:hypothetical protein